MPIHDAKKRNIDTIERQLRRPPMLGIEPPFDSPPVSATDDLLQSDFDGLQWHCRVSFADLLKNVSASDWLNPAGAGFEQIKQNPVRTVWRATLERRAYYLKYSCCNNWKARLKHHWRGTAAALEFNCGIHALKNEIPAVRPVAYCDRLVCGDALCCLLVTEAIEPTYPLSEYWALIQSDEDCHRRRSDALYLIDLLAELIARAHQAGFEHRDMHAGNILVHPVGPRQYETAFVDLQSVRHDRQLDDSAVVRNLGQLNQWFRRHAGIADRLRFLRRYLRWRNEYEQAYDHARALGMSFDELVRALADNARRHAEQIWSKRDRRSMRNCRYFSRIKTRGGWGGMVFLESKRPSAYSRASSISLSRLWWQAQLKDPRKWFASDRAGECKDSHSARVTRIVLPTDAGQLPAIAKRPRGRNWKRRLRQLLRPSRCMRGWRIANALLNRDLVAARPLAVIERGVGPLVFDGILVTEAIVGAVDLEAHLRREFTVRSAHSWARHKQELSRLLARHLRLFFQRGFIHRDCKAQNILVAMNPRPGLIWIDMDGIKLAGEVTWDDELRALTRLHVSLLEIPGLTRTDRVRTLKAYFKSFGSDPRDWRVVWTSFEVATEKKITRRRRRKKWKIKYYGRT